MSPRSPINGDHRESADGYSGEIHRLDRWRVVVCRDGIQYLLQRRRPGKAGVGGQWDSVAYCVTQRALMRLWRQETGNAGEALERLPERAPLFTFGEWQAATPESFA